MIPITYRRAEERDIPEAARLFLASASEMASRHGLPMPPAPASVVEANYLHILRTGMFEVAEQGGRLVALACGIVRGDLWFLSGFWALPGERGKGVGGPLLQRVWDQGAPRGARTFVVWASVDLGAIATYLKLGMVPGYPILTFAGKPRLDDPAIAAPVGRGELELAPLDPVWASRADLAIRGAARPEDHAFLRERSVGHQVLRRGTAPGAAAEPIGYFYHHKGMLGSAACVRPELFEAFLEVALAEAARGNPETGETRMIALGSSPVAIRFALTRGLRLVSNGHLLMTRPFGKLETYLPSGPSLF